MVIKKAGNNIIESISPLIYISVLCSIAPFSITNYYKNSEVVISAWANFYMIISMVNYAFQYHFATVTFQLGHENESGTLTEIVGIFIIYMEPLMMIIDMIATLLNQRNTIYVLEKLKKIDEKLERENIIVNYSYLKLMIITLIVISLLGEFGLTMFNFVHFQNVDSIWWFVTTIPLFICSLSKIWFVVFVTNVQEKFFIINKSLIGHQQDLDNGKHSHPKIFKNRKTNSISIMQGKFEITKQNRYLFEHDGSNTMKKNAISNKTNILKLKASTPFIQFQGKHTKIENTFPVYPSLSYYEQDDSIKKRELGMNNKLNKRLTIISQLHDEICEIGKRVNRMYSFQMLVLMAYGFMGLTAQFYFVYCGLVGQAIPIIFRSAESLPISTLYIGFTGAKCVYIICISWFTKIAAQGTGVQIHKVANVFDEDHLYRTVNHLSLKLLNHQLTFTACGFFDLDMTTLYSIAGAITSYLIILVQFNLAAQRNQNNGGIPTNSANMSAVTTS